MSQAGANTPPDWSKMDPTLFGLDPPPDLPWGAAMPEMTFVDGEDTQKWIDAGAFEPQWLRELGYI